MGTLINAPGVTWSWMYSKWTKKFQSQATLACEPVNWWSSPVTWVTLAIHPTTSWENWAIAPWWLLAFHLTVIIHSGCLTASPVSGLMSCCKASTVQEQKSWMFIHGSIRYKQCSFWQRILFALGLWNELHRQRNGEKTTHIHEFVVMRTSYIMPWSAAATFSDLVKWSRHPDSTALLSVCLLCQVLPDLAVWRGPNCINFA
jgi:hypothetical protein